MRYGLYLLLIVCCVAVASCAANHMRGVKMQPHGTATGFINRTMTVDGAQRIYNVYVPKEYTPDKQWPLVLALHGVGERGDDGLLQTEVGIGRAIRRHADWFPCIVVMPQCPPKMFWDKAAGSIGESLTDVRKAYNIDPNRIYLTGLSMGGFGTWMYGAMHPDIFAALVPICGGGNPEDADKLAKMPIWAFHGKKDPVVAPEKTKQMVDAVKNAGGDIRHTEFPDVGHNAWDPAYDDPDTMKWLLRQKKK